MSESEYVKECRRSIEVVVLSEILYAMQPLGPIDDLSEDMWRGLCSELYECYGHLVIRGRLLWAEAPSPPAPDVVDLIAGCLRRRERLALSSRLR